MNTLPQPVVASSVTVTDAHGRPRVMIGVDEQGEPCVRLLHQDGTEGANFGLTSGDFHAGPQSAHLRLSRGDEGGAVHLLAGTDGSASVEVTSDPNEGAAVVCFNVDCKDGVHEAGLVVRDEHASFGWQVAGGAIEGRGGPLPN